MNHPFEAGVESERVRVVRVVTRLNVGGPSRHVAILSSRLGSGLNGVVLAGSPGAREGSQEDLVRNAGGTIVRVPGLRRAISPADDLRALVWLYRYFRRVRPDIVHTHMAKAGALGRLAAVLAHVPVRVHTFHGHVLEGFFGHMAAGVFGLVERLLSGVTTQFIAISPEIAADLDRRGIGRRKTVIVRLGLDLDRLVGPAAGTLHEELGLGPRTPLVGIVGRLVPSKDHRLFIEAAVLVRRSIPNANFVIVGDGELWDELHHFVDQLQLRDIVHFTGWREDLANVYASFSLVVCSSVSEGTSVSIIEAGAAGRPVVTTDVGGMADVVKPFVNGLLVPPRDAQALAHAIVTVLSDEELALRLGHMGQQMALSRYGAERLLVDIRSVYTRLLRELP